MSLQITGTLHAINPAEQITERFRKREFVLMLEPDGKYPQPVLFQVTNDRCGLLNAYQLGDTLTVSFNLRGREWNGPKGVRYFTSLEVWKIRDDSPPDADPHNGWETGGQPDPTDDDIPF